MSEATKIVKSFARTANIDLPQFRWQYVKVLVDLRQNSEYYHGVSRIYFLLEYQDRERPVPSPFKTYIDKLDPVSVENTHSDVDLGDIWTWMAFIESCDNDCDSDEAVLECDQLDYAEHYFWDRVIPITQLIITATEVNLNFWFLDHAQRIDIELIDLRRFYT